ncbi:MAG: hypothetical protein GXY58_15650 [Planctomycetaceae bacterium]|nr:hypothetical protein [Planctomycetaceae bacterium]
MSQPGDVRCGSRFESIPRAARTCGALLLLVLLAAWPGWQLQAAEIMDRYYAYPAVHDAEGVIAPWYTAQNGQLDFRIRVAAETLKRYPWTTRDEAIDCLPHFLFSGHWSIAADGAITPLVTSDWDNADLGQRSAYVLSGMVDYYRYTGDPAALALVTLQANFLLDHCLTPDDHPWPRFLISVPHRGKSYGKCDPQGMIQLDIAAEVGLAMLRAYQLTGQQRWLEACQHWGDLLAAKRDRDVGARPWSRYANPEAAPWSDDTQTGGVSFLLYFLDELVRLGYTGEHNEIVEARDAGRAYLRDVLLEKWTVDDTWGRNYWDWVDNVQAENVTEFTARYFMDHPDVFPNWRQDARNILTLFLNHTGVCPMSAGDVYSGAWAFPESSSCCGRSLWYGPMELAVPIAQYAVQANSAWARELARRIQILATYDGRETGVSEDNIDGGFVVNNNWFKIAHPMALTHLLGTLAWLPAEFGAARENHIMRSTSVVNSVFYRQGAVHYSTFDAPPGTTDLLRLAFVPQRVTADGQPLPQRDDLTHNGFSVTMLSNGDALVTVRHDGARRMVVEGEDDPQQQVDDATLAFTGAWESVKDPDDAAGGCHVSDAAGAAVTVPFVGNQVRLIGRAAPDGGLADVYVDDQKQLVGIDCWCPTVHHEQVLYYRNGLPDGPHTLRVVVRGAHNAKSSGGRVYVDAAQWSAATGTSGDGTGGGPTETQCLLMGYPGRQDVRDARGNLWRPGTEFIIRTGAMTDSVVESWWTTPAPLPVLATDEQELYRYGVHGKEFWVNATVAPGTYHVRLKFAANRRLDTCTHCVSVTINGQPVVSQMDVAATAGGAMRAVDLVFNGIRPRNGVIDIRFIGGNAAMSLPGEAFVQGIEIGQGTGGTGATPVVVLGRNLLRNAGFEQWAADEQGANRPAGWRFDVAARAAASLECCAPLQDDSGPWIPIAEGTAAARVQGAGASRLVQEVAACPNSAYRASVLVSPSVPAGQETAAPSRCSAALLLEELDADGRVIARHHQPVPDNADCFQYVSTQLTTSASAARLRFVLETSAPAEADGGTMTYDLCVLDGPPALAQLTGMVTDDAQKPLADAVVVVGAQAVRTGADGRFTIHGLADLQQIAVEVNKQGYFGQAHVLQLQAGDNHTDLTLVRLPGNNLLNNGGFEDGFPAARSIEHGVEGVRDAWRFRFSPGINCYIYQESIYEWRQPHMRYGKEAISQVTDGGGTSELFQDVVVNTNQPLVASAWVLGLDVRNDGQGFGAGPDDFAGLVVQELDLQGQVLVTHERVGITQATEGFQHIRLPFTTGPDTAKVRVTLTSHIQCIWRNGAAIFDECALEPVTTEPDRAP